MIIGRDLLVELGIDIKFSTNTIKWDHREIPMKDSQCTIHDSYYIDKPDWMESEIARLRDVLDQKYQPADLLEVAKSCKNLEDEQQNQLFRLLKSHKPLFDGSLGHMKSEPYDIELKDGAKPCLLYTSPSPRDLSTSRMPSSA